MSLTRRKVLTLGAAAVACLSTGGRAIAASEEIFAPDGLAISGYDPVAYFTKGRPTVGRAEFSLRWRGATWRFSDAATMEAFEMNPTGYVPEYGGYCAYAMSKGALSPTVPEAFTIHDGKLFLNFSVDVRTIWQRDIPGNVARANGFWSAALNQ